MKLRLSFLMAFVFATTASLFISGCGGGGSSATDTLKGGTGDNGTWTVLVYMNADNDLEPYGLLNFNQMEKIGSTDKVKVVVQMDRSPISYGSNNEWSGARRYLVTKDTNTSVMHSELLQNMGNTDMGSPDTLRQFIQWGQQTYPADHYCLIIWNHGSGWIPTRSVSPITRNISYDDTSGTSISTPELSYALSAAYPKLDLVAMDACMMQMLEITYQIRDDANYMVASEGSPPGDGYVYDTWLSQLVASPGMNGQQLGTIIARKYVEAYTGELDVAQSVVDLTKIQAVAQATDGLAESLQPHLVSNAAALRTARHNSQEYASTFYKDLLDYATLVNQLVPDANVSASLTQLRTALSQAVVFETHAGSSVTRSHGLSIYVPEPARYDNNYGDLSFAQDCPNWTNLIRSQTQ